MTFVISLVLFDTATATSCSSGPSETATNATDSSLDENLIYHAGSIEQAKQKYGNLTIAQPVLVGGKNLHYFRVI